MEIKILEDRIQTSYLGDKNISRIVKKFIYSKVIQYDEEYDLKEEYSIKYNKRHGEYKAWYENEVLKIQSSYRDGKLKGIYREWYENGQLKAWAVKSPNKLER